MTSVPAGSRRRHPAAGRDPFEVAHRIAARTRQVDAARAAIEQLPEITDVLQRLVEPCAGEHGARVRAVRLCVVLRGRAQLRHGLKCYYADPWYRPGIYVSGEEQPVSVEELWQARGVLLRACEYGAESDASMVFRAARAAGKTPRGQRRLRQPRIVRALVYLLWTREAGQVAGPEPMLTPDELRQLAARVMRFVPVPDRAYRPPAQAFPELVACVVEVLEGWWAALGLTISWRDTRGVVWTPLRDAVRAVQAQLAVHAVTMDPESESRALRRALARVRPA
jgi:hypothetical protein